MSKALLITGATGNQGGDLIRVLLKANQNFQILAPTRDMNSPSATRLKGLSPRISLVAGDLDHPEKLFENAQAAASGGIWGVYSVQVAIQNPNEKLQGLSLIDTAVKHNVQHFAYSSVDRGGSKSINNPTKIPHFQIKHEIEKHLFEKTQDGKMTYTVLRPVAFFENLAPDFIGKVFATPFQIYLPMEKRLQLVAASDIGAIGAQVFIAFEHHRNKALTIVGDELTHNEFKSIFREQIGTPLPTTFTLPCRIFDWMMRDLGEMFKWFAEAGYGGDLTACKAWKGEDPMTFATWLTQESRFRK